jgi:hypothetical protein
MERGKTALKICSWTNAERPVTATSPMALVASTGQRLPDGARRRRRLNTDRFDGCCPLRPSTSMTPPPITATPRSFPLPGPGARWWRWNCRKSSEYRLMAVAGPAYLAADQTAWITYAVGDMIFESGRRSISGGFGLAVGMMQVSWWVELTVRPAVLTTSRSSPAKWSTRRGPSAACSRIRGSSAMISRLSTCTNGMRTPTRLHISAPSLRFLASAMRTW